jgi:hypothetical protein
MKGLVAGAIALLSLAFLFGSNQAGEKGEPKYTIKQVMAKGFNAKKGEVALCGKVASGKASDEEKKSFLELVTALSKSTPPKGEADAWKEKTTALVNAATGAVKGDADAAKSVAKLANCAACHSEHKGKKS